MLLGELLVETMAEKLLDNTLSYLEKKFEREKNIKFEIMKPNEFLQRDLRIDADKQIIRMKVGLTGTKAASKRVVASARTYLDYVLGERFPEDNLLGVTAKAYELTDGALVVLTGEGEK